jgi:hypothetical protein
LLATEQVFAADRMCATIIGGCHSLAFTDGNLIGDPLEKLSFEAAKFT